MSPIEPTGFRAMWGRSLRPLLIEILQVYFTLLKVLIPALIVVKLLEALDATRWLGTLLSPLMQLVGLPDTMGLVWAATMLTNIYTGMAVFLQLAADTPITVAQVTILGVLMLGAHSLPVEGAVARAAGVPWSVTLSIRIIGALILAAVLNLVYGAGQWLQEPAHLVWTPASELNTGWLGWVREQVVLLVSVFVILAALIVGLRILRAIGVERLMHIVLAPLLKLIGIGREAANITVIGMTLGLAFGGGLLIREARSGLVNRRDVFFTMTLLGLCHSLIEDTLLILLLGASLSGILWARLFYALAVVAVLTRLPALNRRLQQLPTGASASTSGVQNRLRR